MTHFSIRGEFDSGRSVQFVPTHVQPLGLAGLCSLIRDKRCNVELHLETTNPQVDGETQPGPATIKTKITFHEPPTLYALVRGGWLPPPLVQPFRFLVDRNVVASLRKLRLGQEIPDGQAFEWWTNFFAQGAAVFSPLPYAFEAGLRRKPTIAEFVAAYDEGAMELREAIPGCQVVCLDQVARRAAYAHLEAHDPRNANEGAFLLRACPLVLDRVSQGRDSDVRDSIMSVADQQGVSRAALVVVVVLSCLYENVHGSAPSIGREIIKPKRGYSEADAFNALSDLRHIELAAAAQTCSQQKTFALCTRDRGVALLWSALCIRGESPIGVGVEFTCDLPPDLFPRLTESGMLELMSLLRAT